MRTTTALFSLCLVAACGNDNNGHITDAAGGDGRNGDGQLGPDASSGSVSVSVTDQGDPVANVQVYFIGDDGSLVSNTNTDNTGTATATLASGGASVTVIEPVIVGGPRPPGARHPGTSDQSFTLDTWNGVQPGDMLHLDLDPVGSGGDSFELSLNVDDDAPDIETYGVTSECGSATFDATGGPRPFFNPRFTTGFESNCTGSADFVVVGYDSDGDAVDSLYAPNLDIVANQTLNVTGDYTTVDEGDNNVFDMSDATHDVDVVRSLIAPNGIAFSTELDLQRDSGGSGFDTAGFPAASTIPGTTVVAASTENNTGGADSQQFIQWAPPADGGYTLDLTTVELPHYTSMGSVDAGAQQIVWTSSSGAQVAPEVVAASVITMRPDGEFTDTWTWNIVAPASQYGAIQLPTLPTDTFDFAISGSDGTLVTSVEAASIPGGYNAARPFAFDHDFATASLAQVGAASGTASESFLTPPSAVGAPRSHLHHAAHGVYDHAHAVVAGAHGSSRRGSHRAGWRGVRK